ncbi:LuxR family transcriptional regulator [Nocardiopsis oceani]
MTVMPLLPESAPHLVGREEELRLLNEHARRCHTGAAAALVLGGDAGIGKTRLIQEFAATRPPGSVFVGGCLELGVDGLAYAPFTAILRQILCERGRAPFEAAAPATAQGTTAPATTELARILPELGSLPEGRPESRAVLFDQVLHLIRHTAGEDGATLVLEDLHWSDGATLDLLVFLVRNLDRPGVQIITTHRTEDLDNAHPLRRLLPELGRLPEVARHDLAPLSRAEVGRQAHALAGGGLSVEQVDELHRRSDGIPLYVEALATAMTGAEATGATDPTGTSGITGAAGTGPSGSSGVPVPERFRDLLLGPVHSLDPVSAEVLRVASVGAVSGEVGHTALGRAAGFTENDLEGALRTLVDTALLRMSGDGYRFRHALLRDAVYGTLLPGARVRLHLRFAGDIEEHRESVPRERHAAELAHHYQAAHDLPRALRTAWAAALQAEGALAHDEQLGLLDRVLDLWERVPGARELVGGTGLPEVYAAAALAALQCGRPGRAGELCDEGLARVSEEGADAEDDRTLTVRAVLLRCRGQARTHRVAEGAATDLAEALRLHPPHMPGYGRMLSIVARESMFRPSETLGLGRSAVSLAEEAHEVAHRTGDRGAQAAALVTLGSVQMSRGSTEAGHATLTRAIALSKEIGDSAMEARASGNLAHYVREQAGHQEALDLLEQSLAYQRERGPANLHSSFNFQNRAETHFELGSLGRALTLVEEALPRTPTPMHRVFLLTVRARTAVALGDLPTARSSLDHSDLVLAWESVERMDENALLSVERLDQAQLVVTAHLEVLLAEGDLAGARDRAGEALSRLGFADSPGYGWTLVDLLAEVVRRSGPRARDLHARVGAAVAGMPVHGPVQTAARASALARLAEGVEPGESVLSAWRTAVAAWLGAPVPIPLAWARLRAARAALAVGGQRAAARSEVRAAHEAAERYGAVSLGLAAADLARRIGLPFDGGGGDTSGNGTNAAAGTPAEDSSVGPEHSGSPVAAPSGLTPREVEVLRLLAQGLSNAGIATELFVSPKTASVHVSNILAKLGVPNRATAGARAREFGLG